MQPEPPFVTEPLDAALQAYLQHVAGEKRLAARTVAIYTDGLQHLQRLAQSLQLPLLALQPQHLRRALAQLHSQGRNARGLALLLSCWRGFFHWAAQQRWIDLNPALGLRAPKAPQLLPKALAVDDAVQLAAYAPAAVPDAWVECRDAAMTELLYSSGLRVGELVGLDVQPSSAAAAAGYGWLDAAAGLVHVQGKGGKRRTVPVGAQALHALQRWLDVRAQRFAPHWQESALFVGVRGARITAQTVWQQLRTRSQLAGLAAPVHPHVLRHSFASHMLQSSGDLRAVQEMLGHADIRTTQVYTRLDFQHLAKVYDQAHPRARKQEDEPSG